MPAIDKVECLLGNKCEFYNCEECVRNHFITQVNCSKCGVTVDEDYIRPYNQGCKKCCSEEKWRTYIMLMERDKLIRLALAGKVKLNIIEN